MLIRLVYLFMVRRSLTLATEGAGNRQSRTLPETAGSGRGKACRHQRDQVLMVIISVQPARPDETRDSYAQFSKGSGDRRARGSSTGACCRGGRRRFGSRSADLDGGL